MEIKALAADWHFWFSVIGTECDAGRGRRSMLSETLARQTSLSRSVALAIVEQLIGAGKLVEDAKGWIRCE